MLARRRPSAPLRSHWNHRQKASGDGATQLRSATPPGRLCHLFSSEGPRIVVLPVEDTPADLLTFVLGTTHVWHTSTPLTSFLHRQKQLSSLGRLSFQLREVIAKNSQLVSEGMGKFRVLACGRLASVNSESTLYREYRLSIVSTVSPLCQISVVLVKALGSTTNSAERLNFSLAASRSKRKASVSLDILI